MSLFDLIMIGISLSMDAFAVSICKGLSVRKVQLSHALICGAWFGAFQAIMPSFGYFLGSRFEHLLNSVGPWVAFILLAVIGVNMVRESFGGDETVDNDFSAKAMLPLAVATSIDAFAVGVGFAAMEANIVVAALLIGCTTFKQKRPIRPAPAHSMQVNPVRISLVISSSARAFAVSSLCWQNCTAALAQCRADYSLIA